VSVFFRVLSAQMFAPPLSAAHASASVSSIRWANSGRRKDFVVREIGDAGQNIRVSASKRKASLGAHADTSLVLPMPIPASSQTVTGG
jgi:hypothetical protein